MAIKVQSTFRKQEASSESRGIVGFVETFLPSGKNCASQWRPVLHGEDRRCRFLTLNQPKSVIQHWTKATLPDQAGHTFNSETINLSYTIHTRADCSPRYSARFVLVPSEIVCEILSCKAKSNGATSHPASTPKPPPTVLHAAQANSPDHVCSGE